MEKTYRINEIFYSLQGEGHFTGTPAVFIRMSGCNLRCPFCDTDHEAGRAMTASQIVEVASAFPSRHAVVTGGEPALQLDDELATALKEAGFYIQVETNGTRLLPRQVDWITCSPKDAPVVLERIDEIKIVFQGEDVEAMVAKLPEAKEYRLQPLSCTNTSQVVEYILKHPRWKLSLQTHKLIDIK